MLPKLLEIRLQQIRPDGPQVVSAADRAGGSAEVRSDWPRGSAPTNGPSSGWVRRRAEPVDRPRRPAHRSTRRSFWRQMEPVEDVDRQAAPSADHSQARLPPTEQTNSIRPADSSPIRVKNCPTLYSVRARPVQSRRVHCCSVLVNQGQVHMSFGILDLIDSDRHDQDQVAMLEFPLHNILDRLAELVLAAGKSDGGLLPGHFPSPVRRQEHEGLGLWVIDGEVIRWLHTDSGLRRLPPDQVLLDMVDDDGGPLLSHG